MAGLRFIDRQSRPTEFLAGFSEHNFQQALVWIFA